MSCHFCEELERQIRARVNTKFSAQRIEPAPSDFRREVLSYQRRLAQGLLARLDEEAKR